VEDFFAVFLFYPGALIQLDYELSLAVAEPEPEQEA
jgi:hypothetical protein